MNGRGRVVFFFRVSMVRGRGFCRLARRFVMAVLVLGGGQVGGQVFGHCCLGGEAVSGS